LNGADTLEGGRRLAGKYPQIIRPDLAGHCGREIGVRQDLHRPDAIRSATAYDRVAVLLAGLDVPDRLVLELARCLRGQGLVESADTLEDAYDSQREFVPLTVTDRDAILRALEECPYGLAELRGVVTLEQAWRVSSGLVGHAPPAA